jgi:hypothetical protein
MIRNAFATLVLSLAIAGVAHAQSTASSSGSEAPTTQAKLNQLAMAAHSPAEFRTVAGYYGDRQARCLRKAAEEKAEWERRSAVTVSIAAKYPRPVDSARNLYEYYMYKASEAATLQAKFNQLAASPSLVGSR